MSDDRTTEFLSLARSLPGAETLRSPRNNALSAAGSSTAEHHRGRGSSSSSTPSVSQELRYFQTAAGDISKDIASTSALLAELTRLVRQKSMFADDSARINSLVVRIKTSIENLNSRLEEAGTTLAQQKRRLGSNSQASQQASNLVAGLQNEFALAASGFKKVLQQRTDNMKETDILQKSVYGWGSSDDDDGDNENAVMPTISSLAPPPVFGSSGRGAMNFPTLDLTSSMMSTGEASGSPGTLGSDSLPRPHGISSLDGGSSALRNRRSTDPSYGAAGSYSYERQLSGAPLTPFDIQRAERESGMLQQMQLIPDQTYLQERANAMSQVETNIVELGTIFNKLAVMVSEHQEMVQRVEDNVQDANTNINLSLGALTDTLTSLRTNRMLALKVFSILILFIVMFIVFFA